MRRRLMVGGAVLAVAVAFFTSGVKGEPVERTARVVSVRGLVPLKPNDACTVGITPESKGGYPCRVTIRCGRETLYGGARLGGYAKCTAQDNQYRTADDVELSSRDGDPWLSLDMASGRATVRDDRPAREVVVQMEP